MIYLSCESFHRRSVQPVYCVIIGQMKKSFQMTVSKHSQWALKYYTLHCLVHPTFALEDARPHLLLLRVFIKRKIT